MGLMVDMFPVHKYQNAMSPLVTGCSLPVLSSHHPGVKHPSNNANVSLAVTMYQVCRRAITWHPATVIRIGATDFPISAQNSRPKLYQFLTLSSLHNFFVHVSINKQEWVIYLWETRVCNNVLLFHYVGELFLETLHKLRLDGP